MAEKMIRVQFSLPLDLYSKLKEQVVNGKWSLFEEIRAGLRYYLAWTKEADKKPSPFDPGELFAIIDSLKGGGPGDLAENHDKYLYGDPHGEKAFERERLRANLKAESAQPVRERLTVYRTKKRSPKKRGGKRK